MNSPKQVLIAARKLIERETDWSPNLYWVGADGRATVHSDDAVQCCMFGALCKASGRLYSEATLTIPGAKVLLSVLPSSSIEQYNDTHTHAEVLAAFDKAIEAAP